MSERPFSQAVGPVVVAHRGASRERPENTIAAFERAIELGADAVECDVRLTADGVPVVMHDATVDRTTTGSGIVADKTWDEIRGTGPVPTLVDALACLSGRTGAVIELKDLPGEPGYRPSWPVVDATIAAIDEVGFEGPAIVISFGADGLARVIELRPELPTGLLTLPEVGAMEAVGWGGAGGHAAVLPFAPVVLAAGPAVAEAAHTAGLQLGTWVSDDAGQVAALAGLGVDAIATNDPAMALAALGRA